MIKSFVKFLRTGYTEPKKDYFKDFVILFSLILIVEYSILLFKAFYYNEPFIEDKDLALVNWEKFISFVLILPLFEEIIFRAPLALKKNINYITPISIAIIILSLIFIDKSVFLVAIILLTFIISLLIKFTKLKKWVIKSLKNNYLIIVIISSLIFGLMHMRNYDTILEMKTFISVIGRVLSGFYLAFLVTKYNLASSYLIHSINNLIPFIILFVFK